MDYNKRPLKRKLETESAQNSSEKPGLKRASETTVQKVETMTASLVQELMNASTSFHKLHLQVTGSGSYAAHKALNEIYTALPDLSDSIAEGYQGACEMLLKYEENGPIALNSIEEGIEYLRQLKDQVDKLQAVMEYSEIINLLDTVKDAINGAKYKLIFLA